MRKAQTIPFDIIGSSHFDRYKKQSSESTWNMIISDGALVPYPGYQRQINILAGGGSARELYRSIALNKMMAIVDDNVYLIDSNLGKSFIGTLNTSKGTVVIAENNGQQIAIADGQNVYIYDYGTTSPGFTIVDVPFKPVYIDFMDGYFIGADGNSHNWYLSSLNNGKLWTSPLSAGTLSTKPDLMVAAVRFNRQLFIIGQKTAEVWHDVGAQLFPFQRDNSISIDYGCISPQTIATGFGLLVWLAANEKAGPSIMVTQGGNPTRISTDGIDFLIDKLKKPEDSTAFLFEQDGHTLYQITFPTDNVTLVYDFTTQKFFNLSDRCFDAHIAKRAVFFDNTHYFVSRVDAGLYEMSSDFLTYADEIGVEEGAEIPRARVTNNLRFPDGSRYSIEQLNIITESGNTHETMKIELSMSKDGGESYGTMVPKFLPTMGKRMNRIRYWNMGSSNDTVFQTRFYGKFRFVIIGGTLEVSQ